MSEIQGKKLYEVAACEKHSNYNTIFDDLYDVKDVSDLSHSLINKITDELNRVVISTGFDCLRIDDLKRAYAVLCAVECLKESIGDVFLASKKLVEYLCDIENLSSYDQIFKKWSLTQIEFALVVEIILVYCTHRMDQK